MKANRAIEILELLSNGIDPIRKKKLPQENAYQNPEIQEAFHMAYKALIKEISNNTRFEGKNSILWKRWTDKDIKILIDLSKEFSIEEIAIKIDRDKNSIDTKVSEIEMSVSNNINFKIQDAEAIKYLNKGEKFLEILYDVIKDENLLSDKQKELIYYRYLDTEMRTLEELGQKYSLSGERIRQIISKTIKTISFRSYRDIANNKLDSIYAKLLLILIEEIKPEKESELERLVCFAISGFLDMNIEGIISLIINLLFPYKNERENMKGKVKRAITIYSKYLEQVKKEIEETYLKRKQEEIYSKITKNIIWFENVRKLSEDEYKKISKKREVNFDNEFISGKYYSQKLKREVSYESGTELKFITELDNLQQIIYFQEQPFEIPYIYKGKNHIYYPDIFFVTKDGLGVIAELKPTFDMTLFSNVIKYSALKRYCKGNGYGLLITDTRHSIIDVMSYDYNRELEKVLLNVIEEKEINWDDYIEIKDQYNATYFDLYAIILKNKLFFRRRPFKIRRWTKDECY